MRFWIAGALVLMAQSLSANEIEIRAGAHDGFTRLVFHASTSIDRFIVPVRNGLRFVFPEHSGGFDTSSTFKRITRQNVVSVVARENEVYIGLSCECKYKTFPAGANMVVLDILDQDPASDIMISSSAPSGSLSTAKWAQMSIFDQKGEELFNTDKITLSVTHHLGAHSVLSDVAADEFMWEEGGISFLQERMIQEIGLAAYSKGFAAGNEELLSIGNVKSPFKNGSTLDESVSLPNVRFINSRAENSITHRGHGDLPVVVPAPRKREPPREDYCRKVVNLDTTKWVSSTDFSREIADKRKALYSNVDHMESGAVLSLAKAYLYFGFGLEAREVLELDARTSDAQDILSAVSEIIQNGYSQKAEILEKYATCTNNFAFWSYLADQESDLLDGGKVDQVMRAFDELPAYLKMIVWPYLGRKLLDDGLDIAAAKAGRSLERADTPLDSGAKIVMADLALAQGNPSAAQEKLIEVVSSNSTESVMALYRIVNSGSEAGLGDIEDLRSLMLSYSRELRDDSESADLRKEQVFALANVGLFEESFGALLSLKGHLSDREFSELRDSVIGVFIDTADDAQFLLLALSYEMLLMENLSPDASIAVANRLMNIGFPELAETILNANIEGKEVVEADLLKARISLALSKPHAALAHMADLSSGEAATMRMRANLSLGKYEEALSIYRSEIKQEDAEVDEGIPALLDSFLDTLRFSADLAPEDDDTVGILEQSRQLVTASERSRDSFETLLTLTEGGQGDLAEN